MLKGMDEVIAVERLSKKYQIGHANQETMLRERLVNMARTVLSRAKRDEQILWALRNVSFSVGRGEVVGIIGRNGAGKSTLLKILSKITYPSSGGVNVRGRVASLLEVGTGFHEELTGRENIFLNGSILGMSKKEVDQKMDAIIEFSGVERFLDTPIKRYSSGMRLRLGFAVAAHLDPDILIVDEVLAVGDAAFQKKCLSAMQDLRGGGRTVLFVSHNLAAVEHLCSRCIWIDGGEVRMDSESREVIQAYMGTVAGEETVNSDLSAIQDRRGNGDVRYRALEYLSSDREPLRVVRAGDSIVMRFCYHAKTAVPYTSFGFRLYTELGTLITEVGTCHHGIAIPIVEPGDGYLELEIGCLNLLPGRYHMSLWITGVGDVIHDGVEHGVTLEVEDANIYGSGRRFDSRFGILYFPQQWSLSGLNADEASVNAHPLAMTRA